MPVFRPAPNVCVRDTKVGNFSGFDTFVENLIIGFDDLAI